MTFSAYLIFLREAQAVVGLQSLDVVGQVTGGDGWVLPHSCNRDGEVSERPPKRTGATAAAKRTTMCAQTHTHVDMCNYR